MYPTGEKSSFYRTLSGSPLGKGGVSKEVKPKEGGDEKEHKVVQQQPSESILVRTRKKATPFSRTTTRREQSASPPRRPKEKDKSEKHTSLRLVPRLRLTTSKTSSDDEKPEKKEHKVRIAARGGTKSTYTKNTPRRASSEERVNTLPGSEDSRIMDERRLLSDLRDEGSPLNAQVRSAGLKAGKQESDKLVELLEFALSGSRWFIPEELVQAKLGLVDIKVKLAQVEKKDDPFVQVGNLVCEDVACELAHELVTLGVDLDENVLMDQAQKIHIEDQMRDDGSVVQWKLNNDQAKGLFLLAQYIGEKVGKRLAATDPTLDSLKNAFNFKKEGEEIGNDGGQLAMLIAKAYVRIAQRVAITMAQSLVLELRKFKPAITNKKPRSNSLRSTKTRIRRHEQVRLSAAPTDLASPSSIRAADSQSPRITAVQPESYEGVTITSPPNPGVPDNNDN